MVSHNQYKVPCIYSKKLKDSETIMLENDIILINEGQFFEDLFIVVKIGGAGISRFHMS